jgi:hypothetical protein
VHQLMAGHSRPAFVFTATVVHQLMAGHSRPAFVFTATVVHQLMAGHSQPALAACPVARDDHTSQGISCD